MRRYLARITFVSLLLLAIGAGVGLVVFQARGGRTFSIQSGSMVPNMKRGGLVGVTPVSEDELKIGDVITFMSPENRDVTITHRIVDLERSEKSGRQIITTQGDANEAPDEPISDALLIGRESFYLPYAGAVLDFIRRPIGLLILIYVPALSVIIAEIRKLKEYYKSLEPYVLPEFMAREKPNHAGRNLILGGLVGLAVLSGFVAPAMAALQSQAALSGNTITAAAAEPEPEPEPEPDPEPPASSTQSGVTLRRVFIACEEGETTASHVQIILYNASRKDADVSGWRIKSGSDTLLTLPSNTIIQAGGLYETEAPIIDGISYSMWHLKLFDDKNEQTDEHEWGINRTRECRIRL